MSLLAFLFPMAPAGSSTAPGMAPGSSTAPTDVEQSDPATLSNLYENGWQRYGVIDADSIRVGFWGGVESCTGFYTEVDETAEAVTVRLYAGHLPVDYMCVASAHYHTIVVDLDEPLKGREVVGMEPR